MPHGSFQLSIQLLVGKFKQPVNGGHCCWLRWTGDVYPHSDWLADVSQHVRRADILAASTTVRPGRSLLPRCSTVRCLYITLL